MLDFNSIRGFKRLDKEDSFKQFEVSLKIVVDYIISIKDKIPEKEKIQVFKDIEWLRLLSDCYYNALIENEANKNIIEKISKDNQEKLDNLIEYINYVYRTLTGRCDIIKNYEDFDSLQDRDLIQIIVDYLDQIKDQESVIDGLERDIENLKYEVTDLQNKLLISQLK